MEVEFKPNCLFEFTCVAEAVAYLHAHGYDTVLEDAGSDHCRIMRGANGDLAIIRHEALLDVKVYEDCGYWEDKLADWASDGAEFFQD
jgi:hypothetical protein